MNAKIKLLLFIFLFVSASLLTINLANAQTCTDPWSGETGQCRSGCGSGEHETEGTCLGQVCCAGGGSGDENTGLVCTQNGGGCQSSCSGTQTDLGTNYTDCSGGHCCVGSADSGYTGGTSTSIDYSSTSTSSSGWNPGNYSVFNLPEGAIYDIIYNFLFWILALFGAFGLIGFIISGIMYLTSAGDDTQIEKAKKAMKWSLVGVIVGLAGLVVILAVDELLGGWSTRF